MMQDVFSRTLLLYASYYYSNVNAVDMMHMFHHHSTHIVFVYGDAKRGFSNHHVLGPSPKFLGNAQTAGLYALYSIVVYPFMAKHPPMYHVKGELYEVDDAILTNLDVLQGTPDNFYREQIHVDLEDGTKLKVLL